MKHYAASAMRHWKHRLPNSCASTVNPMWNVSEVLHRRRSFRASGWRKATKDRRDVGGKKQWSSTLTRTRRKVCKGVERKRRLPHILPLSLSNIFMLCAIQVHFRQRSVFRSVMVGRLFMIEISALPRGGMPHLVPAAGHLAALRP